MKKYLLLTVLSLTMSLSAQVRGKIAIPDLKDFVTLKCDFHIHTVFSDGTVWPTVRMDEAYREGLDALALTEHIEYRAHKDDVIGSHNRSYEIAKPAADSRGLILIRGSEITRSMPPGHHNAIFLTNSDELDKPEYMDAFRAAKSQNAFIFWNHPCWDAQQPDTTLWFDEHTKLLQQGMIQGIEVANGNYYCPEAHRWCLEKKLTMIGNSDIHQPMQHFAPGKHRTMTLVFARNKTPEAIQEALKERRTAIYCEDRIIGEEKYLKELFENALEWKFEKNNNTVRITFTNKSELTFHLKKTGHDTQVVYFREYTIVPHGVHTITVRLENDIKRGDVNFSVENFLVAPAKGMNYTIGVSL